MTSNADQNNCFDPQIDTHLFLSLDQVEKLAFLGVLKHDEDVAARVNELEMLDDVGVVEAAQNFDLPLHFFENSLQLNLSFVQNFDRHFVIGDLIDGHYKNLTSVRRSKNINLAMTLVSQKSVRESSAI